MTQHLLLVLLAIPLMMLGTPAWLVRPLFYHPLAGPLLRWCTRPLIALVLMSRSPWLDQLFGIHGLASAHRWLGFACVWLRCRRRWPGFVTRWIGAEQARELMVVARRQVLQDQALKED